MKVTDVRTYHGPDATDGLARRVLRATVERDDDRQEVADIVVRATPSTADELARRVRSGLVATLLGLSGCVSEGPPLDYAHRAYPECLDHHVLAQQYAEVSLTEVSMTCDGVERSVTIKCAFGWGLISDTTCWVNN